MVFVFGYPAGESEEPIFSGRVAGTVSDTLQFPIREIRDKTPPELDDQLGYSRYDYKNKDTDNSRNGHSDKTLRTSFGDVEVSVPRDRKGEFEPKVLKKKQTSVSQDIEEKILSMYAKGMTTSDIEAHIQDIYGVEVSDSLIGSPAGYVGCNHGELSEKIQKSKVGILLCDEFEKTTRPVFSFFLELLEEGRFTDSMAREYGGI